MRTMKIKWEEELMEQIKDEETCYEKETPNSARWKPCSLSRQVLPMRGIEYYFLEINRRKIKAKPILLGKSQLNRVDKDETYLKS